jgi:AraC-like DNA-binding protein
MQGPFCNGALCKFRSQWTPSGSQSHGHCDAGMEAAIVLRLGEATHKVAFLSSTVHRATAMSAAGVTFGAYVAMRRLDHVRDELISGSSERQSISALARKWGFRDISAFNKAFRKRFGCARASPPEDGSGQSSEWRRGRDSNPRYPCEYAAFRVRCFQPLSHLSRPALAGFLREMVAKPLTHLAPVWPECRWGRPHRADGVRGTPVFAERRDSGNLHAAQALPGEGPQRPAAARGPNRSRHPCCSPRGCERRCPPSDRSLP